MDLLRLGLERGDGRGAVGVITALLDATARAAACGHLTTCAGNDKAASWPTRARRGCSTATGREWAAECVDRTRVDLPNAITLRRDADLVSSGSLRHAVDEAGRAACHAVRLSRATARLPLSRASAQRRSARGGSAAAPPTRCARGGDASTSSAVALPATTWRRSTATGRPRRHRAAGCWLTVRYAHAGFGPVRTSQSIRLGIANRPHGTFNALGDGRHRARRSSSRNSTAMRRAPVRSRGAGTTRARCGGGTRTCIARDCRPARLRCNADGSRSRGSGSAGRRLRSRAAHARRAGPAAPGLFGRAWRSFRQGRLQVLTRDRSFEVGVSRRRRRTSVVDVVAAAAGALGGVHRPVGVAQQFRQDAAAPAQRDADAHRLHRLSPHTTRSHHRDHARRPSRLLGAVDAARAARTNSSPMRTSRSPPRCSAAADSRPRSARRRRSRAEVAVDRLITGRCRDEQRRQPTLSLGAPSSTRGRPGR